MKIIKFFKTFKSVTPGQLSMKRAGIFGHWPAILVVGLVVASWRGAAALPQEPSEIEGADVQTRGPVHEAFAGIISFNPEPGVVVAKPPPELVEEMPPEEKPEGENVTWIPGYWGWDDERNDYLWISGTWRALPPGRAWVAGYWGRTAQGYQWTSGYWVDAAQQESTYLPTPPATIEAGPNIPAPSADYLWMPGCWVWSGARYAWRPGYWAVGRPDWEWVPAHYVWTPRGCIFVGGYWDYPVERRGLLFAPVFLAPPLYMHRHFVYSPSIVIDVGVFTDHLFCRPRYHHYYFGDYYAPAYVHGGFYASFSFHIGRHGYDPIFSHHHWEHRHERDWDHRLEASYRNRRDHEDVRPPRTWIQQQNVTVTKTTIENRVVVASTFDQYRRKADTPVRFQRVAGDERQRLVQRTRDVQITREQRQTLEVKAPETGGARPTGEKPFNAQVPRSSIVGKPVRDLPPRDTPPKAQRTPRPDSRAQPRQPHGQPAGEKRGGTESRASQSIQTPTPAAPAGTVETVPERRILTAPHQEQRAPVAQSERQVQSEPPQQLPSARPERQLPIAKQQALPTLPQPQPPRQAPVARQPERRVPMAPPRGQHGTLDARGGMAQSPVHAGQSGKIANPTEGRRNQPHQPAKKGAEHLRQGGQKDQ